MRGELPRVKTDAGNPSLHQARVLPCRQRSIRAASAREQNLPRLATAAAQIRVERLPRLLGQFETHRPTRFPLAHVGAVDCVAVRRHIIDTQVPGQSCRPLPVTFAGGFGPKRDERHCTKGLISAKIIPAPPRVTSDALFIGAWQLPPRAQLMCARIPFRCRTTREL
jgi:hypothetical protein